MAGFLIVRVATETLALRVEEVERVLRMVALVPAPDAPPEVEGVLVLQGELLHVLDVRARLGLERRDATPDDYLVVVRAPGGRVALRVDAVERLADVPAEAIARGGAGFPAGAVADAVLHLGEGSALVPSLGDLVRAPAPGAARP